MKNDEAKPPKKPRKRKGKIEEIIFTPVEIVPSALELLPAPVGRPTAYTLDLCHAICSRLAEGESLRSICRDEAFPSLSTVMYWLLDADKKEFLEQYEIARDIQADLMAEELLEIADDGTNDWMERELQGGRTIDVVNTEHIQRSRLRVDVRKWTMSKLKPKKYGDKLDLTNAGGKFPTPLLANVNGPILDNNSDTQSPGAE